MKANNLDWYLPNFNFGCSDFDFRFTHSRIYEVRNFPARPRLPRGMPCAVLWWAKHSTDLSLSRLSSYLHYRSVFTRTFIIILSAYRPTLSRPPPPSLPEVDARPPLNALTPRKSWSSDTMHRFKKWFSTISRRNRCLTPDNRTQFSASQVGPLIISMFAGFAARWAAWESPPHLNPS